MAKKNARTMRSEVEFKRKQFSDALTEYRKRGGRFHNPAPELPAEALAGCEMLPNREMLLDKIDQNLVIAELGVATGDFSKAILSNCKPAQLHLFEPNVDGIENPELLEKLGERTQAVMLHMGNTAATLKRVPDDMFDVIFFNGDQAYLSVIADIEAALPKLKHQGKLVFNNYGVWSAARMTHCGVARAVHELCLEEGWRFRYLALQQMMYNNVMLVRD